jgi:two-component system, cell cycle sensor histidine kinase and response regulator CckA
MGYANVLRLRAGSPQEVREAAAIIEKTAERASQLTKQLLGFARKGKLQEAPIDVHTTIDDVIPCWRGRSTRASVSKSASSPKAIVRGDPTQLQQVILNLAVNARDAMPDGGLLTFHSSTVEFQAESSWRLTGAPPGPYLDARRQRHRHRASPRKFATGSSNRFSRPSAPAWEPGWAWPPSTASSRTTGD